MKKTVSIYLVIALIVVIFGGCGGGSSTTSPTPNPVTSTAVTTEVSNLAAGKYNLGATTGGVQKSLANFQYNTDGTITQLSLSSDEIISQGLFTISTQETLKVAGNEMYVNLVTDTTNLMILKGTVTNSTQSGWGAVMEPGQAIIQGGKTTLADATLSGNYIIAGSNVSFSALLLPSLNTGWIYGAWITDNTSKNILIGTFSNPQTPPSGTSLTTNGIKEVFITIEPVTQPTQPFTSLKVLSGNQSTDGTYPFSKVNTSTLAKGSVLIY